MRNIALAFTLMVSVVFLAGCPPLQQTARDGIAASKGFLVDANDRHPSCGGIVKGTTANLPPDLSTATCKAIAQAVAVKDAAIDALEVYCGGPNFDAGSAACEPQSGAQAKLKSALTNLQQTITDIKALK